MKKRKRSSLLWQITHPTTHKVSYIFGTMHLWHESLAPFVERVLPLIEQSELYIAESDLEDMKALPQDNFYLKDKTLADLFSAKKWDKIKHRIQKHFGIDVALMQHLTPFALYSSLNAMLVEQQSVSLDERLWSMAAVYNVERIGLESAQEQLAYYHKIPLEEQAKQLYDFVKNVKLQRTHLQQMIQHYLHQDIVLLYKKSKKGLKAIKKLLIHQRNKLMTDRIIKFSEDKSIFVAVGAGHLAGKGGILNQLKQQKFKVKAVALS